MATWFDLGLLVGARGFEPLTSSVSRILEAPVDGQWLCSRHAAQRRDSLRRGHVTHSVTHGRSAPKKNPSA